MTHIQSYHRGRKASIQSDSQFAFLRDTVKSVPDMQQPSGDDEPSIEGHSAGTLPGASRARKSRTTAATASTTKKGRGRPRKTSVSNRGAEKAVDDENGESDEDEDDELDDNDELSSCDNSNPSSTSTQRPPQPAAPPIPSHPSNHSSIAHIDEDYDA